MLPPNQQRLATSHLQLQPPREAHLRLPAAPLLLQLLPWQLITRQVNQGAAARSSQVGISSSASNKSELGTLGGEPRRKCVRQMTMMMMMMMKRSFVVLLPIVTLPLQSS